MRCSHRILLLAQCQVHQTYFLNCWGVEDCSFVCFYRAACFLSSPEKEESEKRGLFAFRVNNCNASSYYSKPFRFVSGLNNVSEC